MTDRITKGPFTWERQERESGCEVWNLLRPEGVEMTYFCLKNYGGQPGPGFNGWKLVSGGPFDSAGAYSSLEEAIDGVTPYLVGRYIAEANQARKRAERLIAVVENFTSNAGAYFAPDGTLMNKDGTRSVFDDVDR